VAGDPLLELSPNVNPAGSLKNPRGSMMKKWRVGGKWRRAAYAAWEAAGEPRYFEPVRIEFTVRRGRVLDPDNALAGLKSLIDGLTTRRMQRPGLIPDDSAAWVSWAPIRFVTGKARSADDFPHVMIRVVPSALDEAVGS
jgi:hypothetical protein